MASLRKTSAGRWNARVWNGNRYVNVGTYSTKKEAQIEAAKIEERLVHGQTLSDKKILFETVGDEWLELGKKPNVKPQTYEQIETAYRLHIKPYFEGRKIIRIKRAEIKKWIGNFEGYSYGSRIKYLSYLKSIFHYALHEMEVIEKDPSDRLKVPEQDKVEAEMDSEVKYYSLEEYNQLLDYLRTYRHARFPEYRLYYELCLFLGQTGLRISEALAVRWTDITDDELKVERQVKRNNNNNRMITSLKNTASYRTISLPPDLLAELKEFKRVQNKLLLSGKFERNSDGIIFQNFYGHYLTPSTIRETLEPICKKAGVTYKGTHVFRHTHAVLLIEAGASIKYVSRRLGHKTIKTTADVYLDITQKIEKDELEKFALYTGKNADSI
ncbi:tyrosine-type recombinase/integrase [Edaphobacillus lindanitolerans]|nr:site-specific integrase [Edaphobacillus lindanitolerans]